MKCLLASFFGLMIVGAFPTAGRAQTNFTLASLQCDPLSCSATGPLDFVSSAFVSYNAICNGGVVGGFEGNAQAIVGKDGPCSSLYQPQAQVTVTRKQQLEVDGCGNDIIIVIDTVNTIETILSLGGIPVFTLQQGASCDGGLTGPFGSGEAPC